MILGIDSKPIRGIQDLMRNSGQIPPVESESVTITRFQQDSMMEIQLK